LADEKIAGMGSAAAAAADADLRKSRRFMANLPVGPDCIEPGFRKRRASPAARGDAGLRT
jgi:hypothetical protein